MTVLARCLLVVILFVGSACQDLPSEPPLNNFGEQSALYEVAPPVPTRPALLVTSEWLFHHLSRRNIQVLHFGTAPGYANGHIPGAIHVDLSEVHVRNGVPFVLRAPEELREMLEKKGITPADHVVVYGENPLFGARGFFIFEYLGHPRVSLLDGGLPGWAAAGGGIATESPVLKAPGRMSPPTATEQLVEGEWVLKHLGDPRILLLDARSASSYAAGHIPGALNLPWTSLIESPSIPWLKPVPELRTLFNEMGVTRHREIVAYCTLGLASSFTYFVGRYLGFDMRLYDGSYLEWTSHGYPTEP